MTSPSKVESTKETGYENKISTVIKDTQDKYMLFKYAQRGFLDEKKYSIDDFEYRIEINYGVHVVGADPTIFVPIISQLDLSSARFCQLSL